MPKGRPIPGTPEQWIARAKSDLAVARMTLPEDACYEELCFHAQQAAEKAIKAVYQLHAWEFPYIHDLDELLDGLESKGMNIPAKVKTAVGLTTFAWETRYPGVAEAVTEHEYRQALKQAESVVARAEGQMRSPKE